MSVPYRPLDVKTAEIRLFTLRSGDFEDDIHLDIWHVALREAKLLSRPNRRLTLEALRKTLPDGWCAFETEQHQCRVIFEHEETYHTSWEHPDTSVAPELYEPHAITPSPGFDSSFEALSYVWGDPSHVEDALGRYLPAGESYEGADELSVFHIPLHANLASALRHLRFPDRNRVLWTDAICINQQDLLERSDQIKLMHQIYTLAQRVAVWLGPESTDSVLAVRTLDKIGAQLEISRANVRYRSPTATEPMWFRAAHALPLDAPAWQAIEAFFCRTWFERLWIWQEIYLANANAIVVCGKERITWQRLRRAVNCLHFKDELPSVKLRDRLVLAEMLTRERGYISVRSLLNWGSNRQCSDPRDKIFGILSLCGQKLSASISVRYDANYTKDDAYRDMTTQNIRMIQRLDMLPDFDQLTDDDNKPSWVADWSKPNWVYDIGGLALSSGFSRSEVNFVNQNLLEASGVLVTTVLAVSEPAGRDASGALQALRDWEPASACHTEFYPTGEDLLDAYCTVLHAGFLQPKYEAMYQTPMLASVRDVFTQHVSSRSTEPYDVTAAVRIDEIAHMFFRVKGRSLITTASKHIGIGPPSTRPGDHVVALLGCRPLLVLRPSVGNSHASSEQPPFPDGRAGRYKLVGRIYCHGLSDTEALLGPLPASHRVQIQRSLTSYSHEYVYINTASQQSSLDDPRLEDLNQTDWERDASVQPVPPDNPWHFQGFRNKKTGETVGYDPRLEPAALRAKHSVEVQTFRIC